MVTLKKPTIVMATLVPLVLGAGTTLAVNLISNGDFEPIFLIVRGKMSSITVEYAIMLRGLLEGGSIFEFDSLLGMASIFFSGLAIIFVGYLMKGIWWPIIAFSTGTFLFLYFKGLLPI